MGNHVVEIETASVDLDYQEILKNIENTIAERVSDQIADEAWDAVEYSVHEAVSEHEQEYAHDNIGNSNDGVASGVQELLREFNDTQEPCPLGEGFIRAVQRALTWDGTDFKEQAPFSLTLDYHWVRETIAEQVRVQLYGVLHRMSMELSSNDD